jgi:hypothetical protein
VLRFCSHLSRWDKPFFFEVKMRSRRGLLGLFLLLVFCALATNGYRNRLWDQLFRGEDFVEVKDEQPTCEELKERFSNIDKRVCWKRFVADPAPEETVVRFRLFSARDLAAVSGRTNAFQAISSEMRRQDYRSATYEELLAWHATQVSQYPLPQPSSEATGGRLIVALGSVREGTEDDPMPISWYPALEQASDGKWYLGMTSLIDLLRPDAKPCYFLAATGSTSAAD